MKTNIYLVTHVVVPHKDDNLALPIRYVFGSHIRPFLSLEGARNYLDEIVFSAHGSMDSDPTFVEDLAGNTSCCIYQAKVVNEIGESYEADHIISIGVYEDVPDEEDIYDEDCYGCTQNCMINNA